MAHLYDKAPPAFAKDPWAWDYTRDRIEGNTGIPYDQWQGKHFAGSAAMYKNVIKKYGASMESGDMTAPHQCVNCGQIAQHYADDYVCKNCRQAVEEAGTYREATKVIKSQASVQSIKDKLYESLGHAAKDRKAGKVTTKTPASVMLDRMSGVENMPHQAAATASRNYKLMKPAKLTNVIAELEAGVMNGSVNASTQRATEKGESVDAHYEAALRAAQEAGITV